MTEQPPPPPAPAQPEHEPWALHRTMRTASAEAYDLMAGDERAGTVTLQYGVDVVEGILALPQGTAPDDVRGVLAWLTDLLTLDASAGPGGVIHWVVVVGALDDFWRRSPGRRATSMETDLAGTRARVEAVLHQMFPETVALPDGGLAVDVGSVRVFIGARTVDETVVVRVFAITNVDVPLDGDLPRYLLSLNFGLALGRFSVDADKQTVWFDHTLAGTDFDEASLQRTIAAVASTADHYDDDIKQRYGGRTFREEGSPVEQVTSEMAGGYL